MRKFLAVTLVFAAALGLVSPTAFAVEGEAKRVKEWTMLVFLNGHNNLDSFGFDDINEMEQVGSTDEINVVVQWGSSRNGRTKRLLVRKDNNPSRVTSPVVQEMPRVDMGDWRNLVDFVRWGVQNYPAKKYFIDVWDHGSGWHKIMGGMSTRDISHDDHSGNFITTEQLGRAMKEAAAIIGRKVDLYGSDACLMAMAEVSAEMQDSVRISVGSEDLEPGEGWPYDGFLRRWAAIKGATAEQVATVLTEEYVKSYQGGTQGNREITFSAIDLEKHDRLNQAVRRLGERIAGLDASDRRKVLSAAREAQSFFYSDYRDLVDFVSIVERARIRTLGADVLSGVRSAVGEFVIANKGSSSFKNAHGIAFWLPSAKSTYTSYESRYRGLSFHRETGWADALRHLIQDAPN